MSIPKPYFHIRRPLVSRTKSPTAEGYLFDEEYAPGRQISVNAYWLLEKDLVKIFRYIEPGNVNLSVYSHELYQLFLRACTEFESHAKSILKRNGYTASKPKDWNIKDYHKLDQAYKLSDFYVLLRARREGPLPLQPFGAWKEDHTLPWYKDYNLVKHNRQENFEKANFANTLQAIAGVFAILYAQFGTLSLAPNRPPPMHSSSGPWVSPIDGIFELKPAEWPDSEKYGFDWAELKAAPDRFEKFPFT